MDRRKAHLLCGMAAGAVIVCLLLMNIWLVLHVKTLESQLGNHSSSVSHRIDLLDSRIDALQRELLERLEQEDSLFSFQQTALDYADGIITLSVTVTPKEVRQGEHLALAVGEQMADLSPVSQALTSYSASMALPFQADYTPVVSLVSDAGRRAEALESIYTDELLQVEAASCWPGQLYNWPGEEGAFYLCVAMAPEEIEAMELVLREQGSRAELARFPMHPIQDFPQDQFKDGMFAYAAELGDWLYREGEYQLWAELTTKGGLLLAGYDRVGDFSNGAPAPGNGSSWHGSSRGAETLRPAWPNTDD